jgi:hypothetical protein
MKPATKRAILRWIHLLFGIVPILGFIYSPFDQMPNYAPLTRLVFVPILLLTGYWMYAGVWFAILAVAAWLGAIHFAGYGAAVISQFAILILWKAWRATRARRAVQVTA